VLKSIKQTVRAIAIKYQYNLCMIQVIKKYYNCPSSLPTGCEKRYGENEKVWRKGMDIYQNKEQLCITS